MSLDNKENIITTALKTIAITRKPSESLNECELTHVERKPIDLVLAREQHAAYEEGLRAIGCDLISLPSLKPYPDSVFVEDTSVVLPELAVITRPGAGSRRGECKYTIPILAKYRELRSIEPPGNLGWRRCVGCR